MGEGCDTSKLNKPTVSRQVNFCSPLEKPVCLSRVRGALTVISDDFQALLLKPAGN